MDKPCEICGAIEGQLDLYNPDDWPLGPIKKCEDCGRYACPVCYDKYKCCDLECNNSEIINTTQSTKP